jgi:hypothetical protein
LSIAEKRVTHAIQHRAHGRKVDGHFIGQTVHDTSRDFFTRNVGMVAARELPVGALDLLRACVRRNAENVVVIPHSRPGIPDESCCSNDAAPITASQW